jgi:glycosyltransferase involved in cell wall biosynthesis
MVVCLRDAGKHAVGLEEMRSAGVRLVELKKPSGPHPQTLARLIQIVRRERIQLINTHNHLVHHYGVVAGMAGGAKTVNTLHGISTLNMPGWARLVYWIGTLAASHIVAVCAPVMGALTSAYRIRPGKVSVIDNGIPLDEFLLIPERSRGSVTVFGTVGRLVDVKDHQSLIRAFQKVHRSHPECRLKLLGVGELEHDLRQLAGDLGVADAVEFCGYSSQPAKFLAGIDVFVLSSKSEGMPLTLLEAMAAGLPVVATAVGGIPEAVTPEIGWLCPPRDTAALADRLEAALQADLPARGASARFRARNCYSIEIMVQRYEAVYRTVLGQS